MQMNILEYFQNITTLPVMKGEVIFKEGDPSDGNMYFILQGTVAVSKKNPDGKEEFITQLKELEFFGEMALLSKQPRSMTIRVISPKAKIGVLREELFERLAKINSDFLYKLLQSTVENFHRAEMRLSAIQEEIDEMKNELETT